MGSWGGRDLKIRAQSKYDLPAGMPVGIDKTTGKFAPIYSWILPHYYQYTSTTYPAGICKVDTNTFVMLYIYSNTKLFVQAFTFSLVTGEITYGEPVEVDSDAAPVGGGYSEFCGICEIDTNKFVVGFGDTSNSNYGTVVAGTVSGTTITLGALNAFFYAGAFVRVAKLDTNKFIAMVMGDYKAYFYAGTVSDKTISMGSSAREAADEVVTGPVDVCQTYTNEFAGIYYDTTNKHRVIAGTVSGTNITLGTVVQYSDVNASDSYRRIASNGNRAFLISYMDDNNYGFRLACTISGTTITPGTAVSDAIYAGSGTSIGLNYPYAMCATADDKYLAAGSTSGYGVIQNFAVSGTTVAASTHDEFAAVATHNIYALAPYQSGLVMGLVNSLSHAGAQADFAPVLLSYESPYLRAAGVLESSVSADDYVNAVYQGVVDSQFNNSELAPMFLYHPRRGGECLIHSPVSAANDVTSVKRNFVWLTRNKIFVDFTA